MRALAAALLACAAPLPPEKATPAIVIADPTRVALGVELAALLNSEALTRVQTAKMLRETMPPIFAANPDLAALEKEYPGIIKTMLDAMGPIVIDSTIVKLPELWKEVGAIYAEALSEADLRAMLAFYRSPLGEKIIRLMGEKADFSEALREAVDDPDSKISAKALNSGATAGAKALQSELSPAELEGVRKFEMSYLGFQIRLLNPRIQAKAAEWSNREDPATDAKMEALMNAIVDKAISKAATQ